MEPIFREDVLLTKSCKQSQNDCGNEKQTDFPGGCYGCEMEQYRGQHHGADCNGSGWFWRMAGDRLRFTIGLGGVGYLSARSQPFFSACGVKRQVSDSGYFRIFD